MIDFAHSLEQVRKKAPLVQCITNFVTVNDCANIVLAAGGSPSMAHDVREAEEAVEGVQALVCNLGAIDQVHSMILTGRRANQLGIPVILDPVAAGRTKLRREAVRQLLDEVRFSVIRGNATEIRSLAGQAVSGSGVDVSDDDAVSLDRLPAATSMLQQLARHTGSTILLSGPLDLVSDGTQTIVLHNGCATMARITGSGCMLSALVGTFCGAMADAPFAAACSAAAAMGICGELAETRRLQNGTGNASFRTDLIDAVFNLTPQQLIEGVRYEIYK